jgi:pimeloyl-ACP methyl ester carboxylesterase
LDQEEMRMRLEVLSREPASGAREVPLLFVHGAWHGAWCWEDNFLPYFAQQGYRVRALSLRGHGESERPRHFKTMRIARYVDDVAEVARGLPAAPVVIGHSMGGLVVQKYLERHPARAAILLAPVPPSGVLRTTLSIAGRHPLRFLRANATWSLAPLVNTPGLTREAFFTRDTDESLVHATFARIQDEAYWAFLDMLAFNLPRPRRVRRKSVPMLVLGGARDGIFIPREGEHTARAYRAQYQLFPGMGHDLMLDTGWQQVADRMLAWLRDLVRR